MLFTHLQDQGHLHQTNYMAHFAKIDSNNKVVQVIVIDNDQEHRAQEFLANDLGLDGTWIQTSYNTLFNKHKTGGTPLRKNYAGIGYTYDSDRDAFIPPKKFASWILDEDTCRWTAPVPYPNEQKLYLWNEEKGFWETPNSNK